MTAEKENWLTDSERKSFAEALRVIEDVLNPYVTKNNESNGTSNQYNALPFSKRALEYVQNDSADIIDINDEQELCADLKIVEDISMLKTRIDDLLNKCNDKYSLAQQQMVQKSNKVYENYKTAAAKDLPGAKEKVFKLAQRRCLTLSTFQNKEMLKVV